MQPRKLALVIASLAISNTVFSDCDSVYANATRNVDFKNDATDVWNSVFDKYCSANGSMKSNSFGASADIIIKKIPSNFGLSSGSNSKRMKHFCKTYESEFKATHAVSDYKNHINTDALRLYNQCRRLEGRGVNVLHATPGPNGSTIQLIFDSSVNFEMHTVQYGDAIECGFNSLDRNRRTTLKKNSSHSFDSSFAISCDRKSRTRPDGTVYYPRTHVSFGTNQDTTIEFTYPAEGIPNVVTTGELHSRILKLEAENERTALIGRSIAFKGGVAGNKKKIDVPNSILHHNTLLDFDPGEGGDIELPHDGTYMAYCQIEVCKPEAVNPMHAAIYLDGVAIAYITDGTASCGSAVATAVFMAKEGQKVEHECQINDAGVPANCSFGLTYLGEVL